MRGGECHARGRSRRTTNDGTTTHRARSMPAIRRDDHRRSRNARGNRRRNDDGNPRTCVSDDDREERFACPSCSQIVCVRDHTFGICTVCAAAFAAPWSQSVPAVLRAAFPKAAEWKVDPNRIGILGFSAGGETAGLAALLADRLYEPTDSADKESFRANFAILVYPAYLANKDATALQPHVKIPKDCPPFLLIHAADDPVTADSSLLLCQDRKSTRLNSSHIPLSRMPSSA